MKKSIWVTKLKENRASEYEQYAFAFNGKPESINRCSSRWSYLGCDPYQTGVKEDEIVEIIIDTETQSYKIKREREMGWYLTRESNDINPTVRFWNGEVWCACPKSDMWVRYPDGSLMVISDKLPYNEYLRSLE